MENNELKRREIKPTELSKPAEFKAPSKSKKLISEFIASDAESVKDYVITKIIIPRCKALVVDTIKNAAEMLILGPNAVSQQRQNYNSYSRTTSDYHPNSQSTMRPVATTAQYPDPLFDCFEDAMRVIDDMIMYCQDYPYISISEFLQFAGRSREDSYTYNNYGWSADMIRKISPVQIPDGRWSVGLPKPICLK